MDLESYPARVGTSKMGSIWLIEKLSTQNPLLLGFGAAALGLQGRDEDSANNSALARIAPTQGTRKGDSVCGLDIRSTEQHPGRNKKAKPNPGHWGGCESYPARI